MKRSELFVVALSLGLFAGCAEPEPEPAEMFNPLTIDQIRMDAEKLAQTTVPPAQTEPGPVDDDAPEEYQETESGLRYRIRRKGSGRKPAIEDTVRVHYRGRLDDGTIFDSSYPRGEYTEFALRGVIGGWTEGLQLVGVGGMIELEIPPALGYGESGQGNSIPPNATLHFLVELIDIVDR